MSKKHLSKEMKKYLRSLRRHSEARDFYSGIKLDREDFFAPGGLADSMPYKARVQAYRVWESETRDIDSGLPSWIDHLAAKAWHIYAERMRFGITEYLPGYDDLRVVAQKMSRLPESIRTALDGALFGLEKTIDTEGVYKKWFSDIERRWYDSVEDARTISSKFSGTVYKKRIDLIQLAADEMAPDFVEFFEDLRNYACYGGVDAAWRAGDSRYAAYLGETHPIRIWEKFGS